MRLAELPDGDFASAIVRLLVLSTWRLAPVRRLRRLGDPVLAAIAEKGVKELTYHRDYAAGWAVRLRDGTDESPAPARGAGRGAPISASCLTAAWRSTGGTDAVRQEIVAVLGQVAVRRRDCGCPRRRARRDPAAPAGHTGQLAQLLAELQSVARAHPGATW